jgi:hypothetical protein
MPFSVAGEPVERSGSAHNEHLFRLLQSRDADSAPQRGICHAL